MIEDVRLRSNPPSRTSADPLRFGQPGHNVVDGVPLQDSSDCLADAELSFGLGAVSYTHLTLPTILLV